MAPSSSSMTNAGPGPLPLVRVYRIESSEGDVPEGISIDAEGRVWLCTDGKGVLYQLELEA
jgi:hypothetical protein